LRSGGGPGLRAKLRLENVVTRIGAFTLGPVNLEVGDGEVALIFGPNGAGKSTLLKTILGLYRPERGRVLIDNIDVTTVPVNRREVGYVPQSLALFDHMNARDNIEFGLKVRGVPKEERERAVKEVAERLHIEDLLDRRASELSWGQAQRVAIARAVITRPKVLLLDEPASGLDPWSADYLADLIVYVRDELKVATIVVSQYAGKLLRASTRLLFMSNGKLYDLGPVERALTSPMKAEAAAYLGYDNVIPCKALGNLCEGSKSLALRYSSVQVGEALCDGLQLKGRLEQIYADVDGSLKARVDLNGIKVTGLLRGKVEDRDVNVCIRIDSAALVE
jgi:ABC-type sugar transport systems, ATPase components